MAQCHVWMVIAIIISSVKMSAVKLIDTTWIKSASNSSNAPYMITAPKIPLTLFYAKWCLWGKNDRWWQYRVFLLRSYNGDVLSFFQLAFHTHTQTIDEYAAHEESPRQRLLNFHSQNSPQARRAHSLIFIVPRHTSIATCLCEF